MYLTHYNLKVKPFQMSTDPKFLWLGEKHKEALATLKYGIFENKGVLALTGDVGTGKTTLINALVKDLGKDIIVSTIYDPGLEPLEFFNIVAVAFNMGVTFKNKGQFLIHFRQFLQKARKQNQKVLLIIDEAQRIGPELLEEVRLLSNLEAEHIRLLNIFFVGQNEFVDILQKDINRALRQRVAINYNINPLTIKETAAYVNHRLRIAGAKAPIFSKGVVQEIFAFSSGYPRLINIICDHALLSGFVKGVQSINLDIIRECKKELQVSEWVPRHDKDIEKENAKEAKKQVHLSGQYEDQNDEHDSVRLARGLYQKAPATRPDKMPVGLAILSVVLLFLIAGIAGYVYYNRGQAKVKPSSIASLKKDRAPDSKPSDSKEDRKYIVPFIPESKEKESIQTTGRVATSSESEIKAPDKSSFKELTSEDATKPAVALVERGAEGPVIIPIAIEASDNVRKTTPKAVKPSTKSKKKKTKPQPDTSKDVSRPVVSSKKDEQAIKAVVPKGDASKKRISNKEKDSRTTDARTALKVEKDKKPETNLIQANQSSHKTDPLIIAKKATDSKDNVQKQSVRSDENLQVRINSFLRAYCNAYESKQLDRFTTFFTPDAMEKGKPFSSRLPKYRSTFKVIDSLDYRIDLKRYSVQAASGFIRIEGTYYVRVRLTRGSGEKRESTGEISMELKDFGDSFKVRRLDY
jgi:type II secretory pathway predicted ATPase ExeA